MGRFIYFIAAIFLSLFTSLGDFFVKKASQQQKVSWIWLLVTGSVIYACTAFGWFFVLKKMKLSSAAVIYSMIIVLLSVTIGIFYFKEKLNFYEMIGVTMAILSMLLLYRFI